MTIIITYHIIFPSLPPPFWDIPLLLHFIFSLFENQYQKPHFQERETENESQIIWHLTVYFMTNQSIHHKIIKSRKKKSANLKKQVFNPLNAKKEISKEIRNIFFIILSHLAFLCPQWEIWSLNNDRRKLSWRMENNPPCLKKSEVKMKMIYWRNLWVFFLKERQL